MSLLGRIKPNGPSGFGYGTSAEQVVAGLDLGGRVVLVTGCNSGIGLETARVLTARGATVIGLARTVAKAQEAGVAHAVACELSDPGSVKAAVQAVRQLPPIDALVANAGIMALPTLQKAHGYELQWFTNHVGHFLLVTGLIDRLTPSGRVVILSSTAHLRAPAEGIPFDNLDGSRSYDPWTAYGTSKLSNLLFARELARRLDGGRVANAVHPGVIRTNLLRHLPFWQAGALAVGGPLLLKSIPEGAATQVWAAVHPDTATLTGEYLSHCNVARSSAHGSDAAMASRLWEVTERVVAGLP